MGCVFGSVIKVRFFNCSGLLSIVHLALHPICPVLMLWLDGCPTGLPVGCADSAAEAKKLCCRSRVQDMQFHVCCLLPLRHWQGRRCLVARTVLPKFRWMNDIKHLCQQGIYVCASSFFLWTNSQWISFSPQFLCMAHSFVNWLWLLLMLKVKGWSMEAEGNFIYPCRLLHVLDISAI